MTTQPATGSARWLDDDPVTDNSCTQAQTRRLRVRFGRWSPRRSRGA